MHAQAFELLSCLADGTFQSGAALAARLGVSRTTVWQAVRSLEAAGLPVFAVRGRGYRLARPVTLLDADRIRQAVRAAGMDLPVAVVTRIDSTNRYLLQEGARLPGRYCLFAEYQSAGRGRRGRQWLAAPAGSLLFSLAWQFEQGAQFLAGLSLAVGVALAQVLRAAGAADVVLKWPNDLLRDGRKLAGILIEMQGDLSSACRVVIGIGLNIRLGQSPIDQPAADLADLPAAQDRNHLAALLLTELVATLERFSRDGFTAFHEAWEALDVWRHAPVQVLLADGSRIKGQAAGVTDSGLLKLLTDGGVRTFSSGEVSLRPEEGKHA